jgi:hypothetical protein
MRRLIALIGSALATVAFVAVPAQSAAAHPELHHVAISGVLSIHDDEPWPWSDEHANVPYNGSVTVGPFIGTQPYHAEGCAGDEVRTTVDLEVMDDTDGWIHVKATVKLFEGTNCSTTDLEAQRDAEFWVAPNGQHAEPFHLRSTGTGGGDWTKTTVLVQNFTT